MNNPVESKTSYSMAVVAVGTALVVLFAGAGAIVGVGHTVPQAMWAAASALSGALVGILIPTSSGLASPDQVAAAASFTKATATSAARDAAAAVPAPNKQAAAAAFDSVKAAPVVATVTRTRAATMSATEVIDSVVALFARFHDDAQRKLDEANVAAHTALAKRDPNTPDLQAKAAQADADHKVKKAAADAAQTAHPLATEIADLSSAATAPTPSPMASKQSIALFALAVVVLVGALILALLIATGKIHANGCPLAKAGKTQSCDSNVLQIGTVVLSLASAAGGTLLGLFATPDGKPPVASATATAK